MGEESNQIKWVGIRPVSEQCVFQTEPGPWAAVRGGITRTQILTQASATANTATVYTVNAGKSFYLTTLSLNLTHTAATNGFALIRNAADMPIFYIAEMNLSGNSSVQYCMQYPMPIYIPALYDIFISSPEGTLACQITGWLE